MFCFDKIHFLFLLVGHMLEQNFLGIPDLDFLVKNITQLIANDIEILLHSASMSTHPNYVTTRVYSTY